MNKIKTQKEQDLERILNLSKPKENEIWFCCGFLIFKYDSNKAEDIVNSCSWLSHYKAFASGFIEMKLNNSSFSSKKISSNTDKLRYFFTKDEEIEKGKLIKK